MTDAIFDDRILSDIILVACLNNSLLLDRLSKVLLRSLSFCEMSESELGLFLIIDLALTESRKGVE